VASDGVTGDLTVWWHLLQGIAMFCFAFSPSDQRMSWACRCRLGSLPRWTTACRNRQRRNVCRTPCSGVLCCQQAVQTCEDASGRCPARVTLCRGAILPWAKSCGLAHTRRPVHLRELQRVASCLLSYSRPFLTSPMSGARSPYQRNSVVSGSANRGISWSHQRQVIIA
jgi:hypothetical protein